MQKIFRNLLIGFTFFALNVSTVAAQTGMDPNADMSNSDGPCATASTDEGRANCMAAARLRDADMSTPEGRCAGAPNDVERANCIAANKRMKRHDGPRDGMNEREMSDYVPGNSTSSAEADAAKERIVQLEDKLTASLAKVEQREQRVTDLKKMLLDRGEDVARLTVEMEQQKTASNTASSMKLKLNEDPGQIIECISGQVHAISDRSNRYGRIKSSVIKYVRGCFMD